MEQNIFIPFSNTEKETDLPQKFTFPFYYEPHPIALKATEELKLYLGSKDEWNTLFGIENEGGIGKMFGVLVVQNKDGQLGYLRGFSGKIDNTSIVNGFVPPLFDMQSFDNYFFKGTHKIEEITQLIKEKSTDPKLLEKKASYDAINEIFSQKIAKQKVENKRLKKERKAEREILLNSDNGHLIDELQKKHKQESINDKYLLKEYTEHLMVAVNQAKAEFDELNNQIIALKEEAKTRSNKLQQWLFQQYNFLNIKGESENVIPLFKDRIPDIPPSGAGDCAAPKLLQYAFEHQYKPIALAEFWWGKTPNSETRKHGYFYPACRGKCAPILTHMLKGMDVDPNPLLQNPGLGKSLPIVYEDKYISVVNKPAEFMSVPGKEIIDSVQERMKQKYPDSTGPLIVHRLDMSTSGLLVIAKTKDIHQHLQKQFITRKVQKRYIALLDGMIPEEEGFIDLPLRVDHDNRPYQIVCYEDGKSARTRYEVIERKNGKTRIYFYPITGRTHQLRIHASHHKGLNTPIVGDDLYGKKANRLHLHAEYICFSHPITEQPIQVQVDPEF